MSSVDKITEGVGELKVAPKRGSKMDKAEINKSRRRLSVIDDPNTKTHQLDGVVAEEKDQRRFSHAASPVGRPQAGSIYKAYYKLSKVGVVPFNYSKVNQDRPMIVENFRGDPSQSLFGVFDGHGSLGHEVSQYVIDVLPEMVVNQADLDDDPHKALKNAFVTFNKKLNASHIDVTFSGTTAVMTYLRGTKAFCANAGDSRAVLARLDASGKLVAVDMSDDQKPEVESERKRIIASKGRVEACKDARGSEIGPKRVWLLNQDVPGLAMTRSFGDAVAASVGVTAEPEVKEFDINPVTDKFMIICSDGVWEFITSQEAVDLVAKYGMDGGKACKELVKESTKRWNAEEEVVDDTTVVLVYF